MNAEVKTILLAEDDLNDVELTLTALDEYHLANRVEVAHDGEDRIIIDADCPPLAFLRDVVEGDAVPSERDVPLL